MINATHDNLIAAKVPRVMAEGWKERLFAAIEADGRSLRAISMEAGLGPNFINQMKNYDKEPGVKQLIKLADVLGLNLKYLFAGDETDIKAGDEELFQLLRSSTPEGRSLALQILKSVRQAK